LKPSSLARVKKFSTTSSTFAFFNFACGSGSTAGLSLLTGVGLSLLSGLVPGSTVGAGVGEGAFFVAVADVASVNFPKFFKYLINF